MAISNQRLRLIKGQPLKKRDVTDWSEAKILSFVQFADFFINRNVDPHTYDVTPLSIEAARERAKDEIHWEEFLVRIEQPTQTPVQFKFKLMAMVRIVLAWLRSNPHAVNDQMKAVMEHNQRLSWGLHLVVDKKSRIGADIVELNQTETTDPYRSNATPTATNVQSVDVQYAQVMMNIMAILRNLTTGIGPDAIKKLSTADRIKLSTQLMGAVSKGMGAHKPNIRVFKQLVVNNAGREELEKAFVDYAESQNEE